MSDSKILYFNLVGKLGKDVEKNSVNINAEHTGKWSMDTSTATYLEANLDSPTFIYKASDMIV